MNSDTIVKFIEQTLKHRYLFNISEKQAPLMPKMIFLKQ